MLSIDYLIKVEVFIFGYTNHNEHRNLIGVMELTVTVLTANIWQPITFFFFMAKNEFPKSTKMAK